MTTSVELAQSGMGRSRLRRPRPPHRQRRQVLTRFPLALLGALFMALPLVWLVLGGFKSSAEAVAVPPTFLPRDWRLDNFVQAWSSLGGRVFANSAVFTGGVVVVQLLLCTTTAFATAKMRVRGSRPLLFVFVATLAVPGQITLVPQFVVAHQLGWINTYTGLILPAAASTGFGVFMFHQFFGTIPDELVQAARVDGASWPRIFLNIVLPLSKPVLAAFTAVSFLAAWNSYVWPLVAATDPKLRVLPVALANAQGPAGASTTPVAVGLAQIILSTLPLAIAFVLAERWFVGGIATTGLNE